MGLHYVNKCVLLDEHDIDGLAEVGDFETFAQMVEAACAEEFSPEMDFPEYQYLGTVSERFDSAQAKEADYAEPHFLDGGAGWNANLGGIAACAGLSDEALKSLEGGAARFEADTRHEIQRMLEARDYTQAQSLCGALLGLQRSGLPGFRDGLDMSYGGDNEALDCRVQNHGPGRRILAEFAFVHD